MAGKDEYPNKVKIDRRAGAGLAVHNAYEECEESKEALWTTKSFGDTPVVDTRQACDAFIGMILPSSFLCNPFIHVELFGKSLHIVGETESFGAPRRDEFIFVNDSGDNGTKLTFSRENLDNAESTEFNPNREMYLVIQIMDDEGSEGRDRVIGESIVTLSNFAFDANSMNYLELPMFEPRNLKYCGTVYLKGFVGDGSSLVFEFIGIKSFADDNAYLVKDDTYTETRNDLIVLLAWFSYMLIACGLYVAVEDDMIFGDALYTRIVTAFTVGYGDIYAVTRWGKIINAICIIIDTITLGYIAGKVMKYIIQFREKKAKENEQAEMEDEEPTPPPENANDKNVSGAQKENKNEPLLTEKNKDGELPQDPGDISTKQLSKGSTGGKSTDGSVRTRVSRQGSVATAINYQGVTSATNSNRMHHESDETLKKLYKIAAAVGGYIVFGTLWFWLYEEFTFAEAFEWNFVTLSTVGYGNVTPQTPEGKVLTCIYIITGVTTLAYFGTTVFEYIEDKKAEAFREQMISGALINEAQLLEFDTDGDGKIDKYEFLAKMVVMTGECEQEKIDDIMKKFNELDEDGGGTISVEELRKFEQQAAS